MTLQMRCMGVCSGDAISYACVRVLVSIPSEREVAARNETQARVSAQAFRKA